MKKSSHPEHSIVIDVQQKLNNRSIALVILYGLDPNQSPISSASAIPDIISDSCPDIFTVNKLVKKTYLEAGSNTTNHEFIQNWYESVYEMDKPTFNRVLDAVESYVHDLRKLP